MHKPLDFLNERRGKEITVTLKSGKEVSGKLVAFDLSINITLDDGTFISGKDVVSIRQ